MCLSIVFYSAVHAWRVTLRIGRGHTENKSMLKVRPQKIVLSA